VDVDWFIKLGLNKGITEVDATGFQFKHESEDHQQSNSAPHNNWGKGVGYRILEVATNTVSSLKASDMPFRMMLMFESPSSRKDMFIAIKGFLLWNFGPSTFTFKGRNFNTHG
jgi:hypothetical protein